jgi:hypothetical protein
MRKQSEVEKMNNKPEKQFKTGAISATIWNNSLQKDGKLMSFATVSLQRSYQKDGQWQSTSNLRVNDLPKAALVLQKAYEYLAFKENSDTAGNQVLA